MPAARPHSAYSESVAPYGFIYGRKAIDELVAHGKRSIRWKPRVYYQQV